MGAPKANAIVYSTANAVVISDFQKLYYLFFENLKISKNPKFVLVMAYQLRRTPAYFGPRHRVRGQQCSGKHKRWIDSDYAPYCPGIRCVALCNAREWTNLQSRIHRIHNFETSIRPLILYITRPPKWVSVRLFTTASEYETGEGRGFWDF